MNEEEDVLQTISKRLFRSWGTTVIGIGIFAFLVCLGIFKVYEWDKLIGWMVSAAFLLFFKGSKQVKAEQAEAVDKALEKAGVPPEERPAPPA